MGCHLARRGSPTASEFKEREDRGAGRNVPVPPPERALGRALVQIAAQSVKRKGFGG